MVNEYTRENKYNETKETLIQKVIKESDHATNIERMKTKMKSGSKVRIGQEAKCMDNALVRDNNQDMTQPWL